ncbi:MAG: type II toxin-antitoxin system HicA family toxin [Phototrophicaceae bacterium]|jgi:predicted RNA binding protein YcfA (HicA-like mRNA interferase family)
MTKREKRLQKLRQNPKDVSFDDLRSVLEDFGFEWVRSSGSHHSFNIVIDGEPRLFVVPYRRPVKPTYVNEALRLIDLILAAEADEEDSNDDPDPN